MVLFKKVEQWADDKGLLDQSPKKQFLKVVEEIGEIAEALAKGQDKTALREEIGDAIVTLIILSKQSGLSAEECLTFAYDKIVNRKGAIIDGVFVKEDDL